MVSRREAALVTEQKGNGNGVKPVTRYQTTDGAEYKSKEEADTAQAIIAQKEALAIVVDRFFYRDMSKEDILQGLVDNFPELVKAFQGDTV